VSDRTLICIIDDDESFREALTSLVGLLGYHVDAFQSAEDFLKSDVVDRASCVISDVQMPGMSGLELRRLMLAAGRYTPFIFVTAFPDEGARTRALRDGAIGYLEKPMQEASLLACLEKAACRC
jgi:FixJ family two-component response regulator